MRLSVCNALLALVLLAMSACSGGNNGASALPGRAPVPINPGSAGTPSSSAITEFPIAAADSAPTAITVALDGNPWFLSAGAVNRLTPTGIVSQFKNSNLSQYNRATDIIVGPDGALYFTANCNVADPCFPGSVIIVRSSTSGDFTLLLNANAGDSSEGFFQTALVSGTDGTIWAALGVGDTVAQNGSAYEQIRTDGTVIVPLTRLPQPCINAEGAPSFAYYSASGIARGGDGAIYIAASSPCGDFPVPQGVSVVLRIDPATGKITNTFPVPNVSRITRGPDGNLWVTQGGSTNAIGRLTPAGPLTEFPLPTSKANPIGITLGNDGALWFTEADASKIGRITAAGAITEFSTPTPNSKPYGIASLPGECGPGHGDIWFTEFAANKIGRMLF
jgi:streptogramin lyase